MIVEAVAVAGVLMYVVVGIIVYTILKHILLGMVDMLDEEDKELLEDEMTVKMATFLISAGWVITIPVIIIESYVERAKY